MVQTRAQARGNRRTGIPTDERYDLPAYQPTNQSARAADEAADLTQRPSASAASASSPEDEEVHSTSKETTAATAAKAGPIEHTLAIRGIALELWNQGLPTNQIIERTGIKKSTFFDLLKKAKMRGFERGMPVLQDYVTNKPRCGRPKLVNEAVGKKVISTLTRNSTTRQYSLSQLAEAVQKVYGIQLSHMTLWRWLKKTGYSSVKHTTKPGLNKLQRIRRLQFAWEHKDWTLEQWKKVVWSDETSVILGSMRGKRRVWRLPREAYSQHCVRQRWKGKKEFMFWACFAYHHKGPCYIWANETAAQTKAYNAEVTLWNEENEARLREQWEINNSMRRLNLKRKPPGKKPAWKFTKANGKWVRNGKGGIDALRYKHEVLLPLFFPFLESLPCNDWLAQEDNASPHAQWRNKELWKQRGFQTVDWPPNSPDLAPIEPAWFMLKCFITKKVPRSKLRSIWKAAWAGFPQEKLQKLVERLPNNIQWVLYLRGNNLYKEGSVPPELTNQEREYLYSEIEAILGQSKPCFPAIPGVEEGVEKSAEDWVEDLEEDVENSIS